MALPAVSAERTPLATAEAVPLAAQLPLLAEKSQRVGAMTPACKAACGSAMPTRNAMVLLLASGAETFW